MTERLRDFFSSLGIEYFSILSYSDCRECAPEIMSRESFTPRSVILYLLPYYTGECKNMSKYAASLDYHIAISEINLKLLELIREHYPTASCRGYGDHSPIDERHAAVIGGLGVAGDSGLLINEKYGTYVFVADMITDIEPSAIGAMPAREYSHCARCGACLDACPTGILRGEGCDCLSAITQRKGELSESECAMMRRYNTAWGCDICQDACPHNSAPVMTPIEFFYRDRIDELTEGCISSMTREQLRSRAFGWRGRKTVCRNVKILTDPTNTENENAEN